MPRLMEKEKPRLARLTAIITKLQSQRMVTATELARKHGVSVRTIYRDMRTLESSGVPIVTEEGRGYSLMDGYKLPPIMFTEEEALAIVTAGHLLEKNKDESLSSAYQEAVTKIKSVLRSTEKEKAEMLSKRIQIRNYGKNKNTSNFLIQLQTAITGAQVLHLDYKSLEGEKSQRHIEPFAIYSTQEHWVLIAFCRLRQDFRAFRLDCIQQLTPTNEVFEPHEMTLQQYFDDCRKKWNNTPDTPLAQGTSTFVSNQHNSVMQEVKIEPFDVIGIAIRTSNNNGQAAQEIAQLWQRFMAEGILQKIPNRVDDTVYSLYTEYEGDHSKPYTAMLGCKVTNLDAIPVGLVGKSFDGGTFAKSSARGDLMQGMIVNQWMKIWESNLDRAYTVDFEVFGEKAQNPADAEVDFLVAVNS